MRGEAAAGALLLHGREFWVRPSGGLASDLY